VLAAGRIGPDGAGPHIGRPVKSGFDTVSTGLFKHLGGCIAAGYSTNINLLFSGDNFFFRHLLPPFVELLMMDFTGLFLKGRDFESSVWTFGQVEN
jgi:hypothetical protein